MNLAHSQFQAQRLAKVVSGQFPVDLRMSGQVKGDQRLLQLVDHHGEPLLDLIQATMTPALKRLRALGAQTHMKRTIPGTAEELVLEVGLGISFSYRFNVVPFSLDVVLATADLHIEETTDYETRASKVTRLELGGLVDLPQGPTWLHIPDERWRAASPRYERIDVGGLPPLEDVVLPYMDQAVGRIIADMVAFRRRHGFPVHPSELGPYRRKQLLDRLQRNGA